MSFKWSLDQLRTYMHAQSLDYDQCMARIKDSIVKTLIAVEPEMTTSLRPGSHVYSPAFELYGFDVLVDQNLDPWVLEVNIMPSLSSSSAYDKRVKTMLMVDTFNLIGVPALR